MMKGGARTPAIRTQNIGSRRTSARVQWRTSSIPPVVAMPCGDRSRRNSPKTSGRNRNVRQAAAIHQEVRQPTRADRLTKVIGRLASANGKPSAAIDTARPRCASNQRPVAVSAVWVIIPWPNRRKP